MMAKPYPVSAQLLCPRFLTDSILSKIMHMKVWCYLGGLSHASLLFINHWSIVFRYMFVYLQPLFVTHVLIVEGLILI